jgi:hypothetical protein
LPTQGSHRPVRARTRAYGSSTSRFTIPHGTSKLLRPMTWTCFRASMCSARFLSRACWVDASLPSTGSSEASSPASTVLSKRYDILPSVPPHFVSFAWRYLAFTRSVRSPADECAAEAWSWSPGDSGRESTRKRQDLPSSWGTPIVRLHMFSRRRQDCPHQTITVPQRGPWYVNSKGSHEGYFDAQ